jgi:hypothetical protein
VIAKNNVRANVHATVMIGSSAYTVEPNPSPNSSLAYPFLLRWNHPSASTGTPMTEWQVKQWLWECLDENARGEDIVVSLHSEQARQWANLAVPVPANKALWWLVAIFALLAGVALGILVEFFRGQS